MNTGIRYIDYFISRMVCSKFILLRQFQGEFSIFLYNPFTSCLQRSVMEQNTLK